jgi:hypothetical protein
MEWPAMGRVRLKTSAMMLHVCIDRRGLHDVRAGRRTPLKQLGGEMIVSQPFIRNTIYAPWASVAVLERYAFMRRG